MLCEMKLQSSVTPSVHGANDRETHPSSHCPLLSLGSDIMGESSSFSDLYYLSDL